MSWIYFVILATFTWSVTSVMDKFLVDKRVDQPLVLAIFVRITSTIPLLLLVFFVGFSLPPAEFTGWILLASGFAAIGNIVFYKAIHIEEVSRVLPLFQFIPVFVLFISFIFIGEVLGFFDYMGFLILIIGGLIISSKRLSRLLRVEKVFWWVLVGSLSYAASYVILKYVLSNVEYWNTFILLWAVQTVLLFSLLGMGRIRRQAKSYLKKIDRKDKAVILADSFTSIGAFIFNYYAISLGPVTLVQAAGNIQLVFVFLWALFFTRVFPHVMEEKFDRKITIQKISGILLIIIGILLTQLL